MVCEEGAENCGGVSTVTKPPPHGLEVPPTSTFATVTKTGVPNGTEYEYGSGNSSGSKMPATYDGAASAAVVGVKTVGLVVAVVVGVVVLL